MKIPFDRVVTLVLPYVSVVSGAVAAWLLTNVQILGLFNFSQTSLEGLISAALVFGITTGAAELGRSQWLKGRRIELTGVSQEQVLATQAALTTAVATALDPNDLSDEEDDTPSGAEAHDDGVDISDSPEPTRPEGGIVPDNPEP